MGAEPAYTADVELHEQLAEAAKAMKAFVPDSWQDKRLDDWQAQCLALEAVRRAEGQG